MAFLPSNGSGMWWSAGFLLCAFLFVQPPHASAQDAPPPSQNSCYECHSLLEPPLAVTEDNHTHDIHVQKGITCVDCHGGDPTTDEDRSMSKAAGFRGKPTRKQIPQVCGSCHSNGAYMRKFNPSLRTDQLQQYHTSVHFKRISQGDDKAAVCTDCHGVHEIRPVHDPTSSVYPANVSSTCGRCHADNNYMKQYKIPTDQLAGYRASVHYHALVDRNDLSAPNCATCHGNHGAAPPGVNSVENVCANCHVFQAQLFDASPHKKAFAESGMPGCVTCHSNHRIEHPSDAMVGTGPQAVCTNCHVEGDTGFIAANKIQDSLTGLAEAIQASDDILESAERSGMEVSQPKMEAAQARDELTKARVTLHSFEPAKVEADVQAGMKVARSTQDAGYAALKERDFRRKGLAFSLISILIVVLTLRLYIREIERPRESRNAASSGK